MQVLAPPSVCDIYPKCKVVEPMKKYQIGNFQIMPLSVEHNVECLAYIIDHKDMGRLIFATDLVDFPYKIPNVSHILLEVNHSDDIILDNLVSGKDVRSQYENHMSLDTAISVLNRLKSSKLSKVVCCHLSASNADENVIKERIWRECGIRTLIAESGLNVCLDEEF